MKLETFEAYVHKLAKQYKVLVQEITFNHRLRSTWGYYSDGEKGAALIFSPQFIEMNSKRVLRILILHELVHFYIPNHGKGFWRLLHAWGADNLEDFIVLAIDKNGKPLKQEFDRSHDRLGKREG